MGKQASASEIETVLKLEEFLPYRLARAAEIMSRSFAEIYKKHTGMTRPEWRAFATVGQFGTVTATFIGQHSSMHKTKVSRAVVSLEQRGWLARTSDGADRRIEHLALTKKGWRVYAALIEEARKFEADVLQALGEGPSNALISGLDHLEQR